MKILVVSGVGPYRHCVKTDQYDLRLDLSLAENRSVGLAGAVVCAFGIGGAKG